MTFPIWMLLGFALWTLAVLLFTVGVYRWSLILTGRAEVKSFRADDVQGRDWYRRAMRAHANCVENLPVFGVIVFALYAGGFAGPVINFLAATVLGARICQSVVHVALPQTNPIAFMRFLFFFTQLICFIGLGWIVIERGL
ncbi:MAPEG family protein [Marinobacteraceae bacterium S3BR75-40.1]